MQKSGGDLVILRMSEEVEDGGNGFSTCHKRDQIPGQLALAPRLPAAIRRGALDITPVQILAVANQAEAVAVARARPKLVRIGVETSDFRDLDGRAGARDS